MQKATQTSVEPQAFKEVMARWASGVTIVTTRQTAMPVGMTVSSFASVSLQPAQILICVNQKANTHAAITESRFFAINLLAAEQVEWGMRFAGQQPAISDRFADISWSVAQTGAPILPGVLGWLDCHLSHTLPSGDHTIFIGTVVACDPSSDLSPLLYYRRAWRQLEGQDVLPQR